MGKEPVVPSVDLHELRRIMRETGADQTNQRRKADPERPQFFLPVPPVVSKDRLDIVFVNGKVIIADTADIISSLIVQTDALLVSKCYLGIRDNGGQKDCMGRTTLGASDSADAKADKPIHLLHRTFVVAVNREAGGVHAGTDKLMELEVIYNRIIKGLRNLIAIWDKNGYHSIVNRHGATCVCEQ